MLDDTLHLSPDVLGFLTIMKSSLQQSIVECKKHGRAPSAELFVLACLHITNKTHFVSFVLWLVNPHKITICVFCKMPLKSLALMGLGPRDMVVYLE